jgi:8-oxo-dGTP pyrophosphatase MutT (NUDIX family)
MDKKLRGRIRSGNMETGTLTGVGCLFWSRKTNRFLFVLRNTKTYKFTWALVGGKVETGETVYEAMCREITEELGSLPDIVKTIPIEKFTHKKNKFIYETFVNIVEDEFIPVLNDEHVGYSWVDVDHFPKPLHPGLFNTLNIDAINDKLKTLVNHYVNV